MNDSILNTEIQNFINSNLKNTIEKLILKGSPFKNIAVQELANQILAKRKSEGKLPSWFQTENIYYPPKLSIEQTSSEITANYKASLIKGNTIIDLTGGFGVDCYAFSQTFKQVIHCEINEDLSKIVKHNYQQLNANNIETIATNGIEFLKENNEKYDWIYIDPSRRNDIKGKVFLLDDCLPNVPKNIDLLFSKTNNILIKNSPILDITSTINELNFVKEIQVIAVQNEVKELLFILEKDYVDAVQVKAVNLTKHKTEKFSFNLESQASSTYSNPLQYLYEPNAAILKSGGFHEVSEQLNIAKLHQHSHLYTSNEVVDFPGRTFTIQQVTPFNKKELKKHLPSLKANITTRNFPISVAEIRKKTKIKDGGNTYLFFTTNLNNEHIIIICVK
ncbi:SAM-dependent methyltransferase [Tenacibaculum holothuriorum]|uniref:SAM-dependent methyltransferase n=1 Tax=Tenacibaculum holothuriorum TaxID=1635173 RepID=A0A1Y2PFB6_9FLAO|nr:class I SAM-dependent methyltransferase [Tenacibaculum holothuriorum]OSY89184.1 SAM-dependent methyltransferase [Tenacibaculum holothuriorum]